jgi:hypothetical protein
MDPQYWRQAYELGFSNTLIYGREWPVCVSMDDIWFRKPVEIGAMLHFSSQICYVQDNRVQTRVAAEVRGASEPQGVDTPPPPSMRGKAGRNHLNEEISPSFKLGLASDL